MLTTKPGPNYFRYFPFEGPTTRTIFCHLVFSEYELIAKWIIIYTEGNWSRKGFRNKKIIF